jgi:ribosomal protein S18 acetylase RimI-like enzyme
VPAAEESVLDNPVWSALTGRQAPLAVRRGFAARFDPAVSPFVGLADDSADSWADLAELLPAGAAAVMFQPAHVAVGWTETFSALGLQMIAETVEPLRPRDDSGILALGPDDYAEMHDLASRTRPGPFERRTPELGGYLGVRRDGELVAMAGERLRPTGWTEISAVCTDESVRGQGLAGRLVRAVATSVTDRGDRAMLHVAASNSGAIALYERLGFRIRREVGFAAYLSPRS